MKITIDIDEDQPMHVSEDATPRVELPYGGDPCRNCPNRPKDGEYKACCCSLPYMYGPLRVTC